MSMFRAAGMRSVSKQLAHTTTIPALGNKDLKLLQDLITAEKAVMMSSQRLADDFAKAAEALKFWGLGEGEDLGDVLTQVREILIFVSQALVQFSTHETAIRVHMKAVRTREENLDEIKRRRKHVGSKAESADKKLSKMGPEHKQLASQTDLLKQLKDEMKQLDADILVEEARLSDYKRQTTKDWMALKFGGLVELSEKVEIVGNVGKQLIEEIPLDTTTPGYGRVQYFGHEQTQRLLANAARAVSEVVFDPSTGNLSYQYEPGQQHYGPSTTSPLPPDQVSQQSRPQVPHSGGLPPQPHSVYSGLPEVDSRASEFAREASLQLDRSYPSAPPESGEKDGIGEFGQPFERYRTHTLTTIASSGIYPPRTSSVTASVRTEGSNGGRFATFPARPVNPSTFSADPGSPGPSHLRNETTTGIEYADDPPSPAVPPKDNYPPTTSSNWINPVGQAVPPTGPPMTPSTANSFNASVLPHDQQRPQQEIQLQDPPRHTSPPHVDVRRSQSGFSDTGADLVLAYYHTQDGEDEAGGEKDSKENTFRRAQYTPSEENPYAEDAYNPISARASPTAPNRAPRQSPDVVLNEPPTKIGPTRGTEDLKAANAAAAREIGRELDKLAFDATMGTGSVVTRPPPRGASIGVARSQTLDQPPQVPPASQPAQPLPSGDHEDSLPPTLSLDFPVGAIDFSGLGTSPIVTSPAEKYGAVASNAIGRPPRSRSPPPSFEVATSTNGTPVIEQGKLQLERNTSPESLPEPRPQQVAERQPSNPNLRLAAAPLPPVMRSPSNISTTSESSLSSLPHPNPPFMTPAPARGMASMPSSPTGEGSSKTITAGAFKKFRAPGTPSPGLAPASGTPSPEQSPGSFTIRKRAPPLVAEPSYGSTGSGATNFASAPTSPIGDRGAPLPGRSSLEGRPSGIGGYTPSPLSLPVDAASSESSHSIPIGLGTGPLQPPLPGHGSDFSRVSYLSAAPGSPLEGDPSMIGVAVGSPSGEYTSGATAHRLTIGDAGWKPGMPARYAQNPSDASGYFPPPDGEDRGLHPGHGRYGAGM